MAGSARATPVSRLAGARSAGRRSRRYDRPIMLTTDDVIDRMLAPVAAAFTGDGARRLSEVRLDDEVQAHLARLAELANEGQLTPDQRADYDFFLTVGDVISLLKGMVRQGSAASVAPVA